MSGPSEPLLSVEALSVDFASERDTPTRVLRNVSFTLRRGETVGLVGESGCGKTLTALAILRLLPERGRISAGHVLLSGEDLSQLSDARMRSVRGGHIGIVFQEPMAALNPVLSVGFQIAEAIRLHQRVSRRDARQRAVNLLRQVAMPDPERRVDDFPHQLSGGQRQRALLAMALAAEPDILIADEPTTALDATVQAQILDLLGRLQRELHLSILLITHDLSVVAGRCDRVLVMYAGEIVEEAMVREFFERPAHPYSRALLKAVPRLGRAVARGALPTIPGRVPEPGSLPPGCPFHPRCLEAMARCSVDEPALVDLSSTHTARCLLWDGEGAREDA